MTDTIFDDDLEHESLGEDIADWVQGRVDDWRDYFDSNYKPRYDEFYRAWRGEWASEDKERESERSKLVSPSTMQAIEENAAEVEEATFGRGDWFDIRDDVADQDQQDISFLRKRLHEDFAFTKTKKVISEAILNAAIYGTGCAEIVLDEVRDHKPATQDNPQLDLVSVGVETTDRTVVKLRSILPQNFLVDPNASSIDDALGVAIDEFVSRHHVDQHIEAGIYRDVDVGEATQDSDLEPTQDLVVYEDDRVRLTRYFGLVPREMLDEAEKDNEDGEEEFVIANFADDEEEDDSYWIEAVVVLGNGVLLKAERNPYMMEDRPVIAFQWDNVPGRFYGRGVAEKGYNSQKAIDTELRARVDALALTIHPMMAIDATRMPRGSKPTIRPGKMLKVNGNPTEILHPFNFGQVSQINFEQARALQQMHQQATGAVNAAGMPNAAAGGDAAAGAISMSLGAVLKRHKRTLMNFQECFLIPLVAKTAWRYMQFDPENYPIGDYKFRVNGSLGTVQREYETGQLTQLMQSIPADTPAHSIILKSVVENMSLSSREEVLAALTQAEQPNPEAQAKQEAAEAKEIEVKDATIGVLNAQAQEAADHGNYYKAQAQAVPMETKIAMAKVAQDGVEENDGTDQEFEKRLRILSELREERKVGIQETQAATQLADANKRNMLEFGESDAAAEAQLQGILDA